MKLNFSHILVLYTILDIIIGTILAGDLSTIPKTEKAMSFGMLKSKVFSKATAYIRTLGGILLLVYIVLVTFVSKIKY